MIGRLAIPRDAPVDPGRIGVQIPLRADGFSTRETAVNMDARAHIQRAVAVALFIVYPGGDPHARHTSTIGRVDALLDRVVGGLPAFSVLTAIRIALIYKNWGVTREWCGSVSFIAFGVGDGVKPMNSIIQKAVGLHETFAGPT